MPNLLENQKQVVVKCVTRLKRCSLHFVGTRHMDSFLDRLKQSGKSVKFAVAAANIGLVLVATGIHAALIKIAEVVKPNPIPDIPGVARNGKRFLPAVQGYLLR
jgi:hypothetical protein